jgi:hypothetical protein
MKARVWLYIAAFLMTLLGLLRGIGGIVLLLQGSKADLGQPVTGSPAQLMVAGLGLVLVLLLFIVSSFFLVFTPQKKKGRVLGWIAIVVFLAGGIINSYLLFGQPPLPGHLSDQIFNFSTSIVIVFFLLIGRRRKAA